MQALELAERAVRACLSNTALAPDQIDHVYFVTTTGLTTPSLDALLAARLGMRPDVRRTPVFGLGCAAGAGALARACDVLRASPDAHALVVSVELCSLVFSTQALTPTDLVGVALFGDGAAAVVLGGDGASDRGAAVVDSRSQLFLDAPDLMGWNFTGDGMRLVLSREIPEFVAERVVPVLTAFLEEHGMSPTEIDHFLLHPGGPKVMATYRTALGLSERDLRIARESMRQYGNLSSASVLFMLSDLLSSGTPSEGDRGLMLALGPGFAAEMLLLAW
jgi:alkylresorcinol/alkylpyrone synthase